MGCYHSVTVNAPVDQVWDTLRKFHDFSWCPDVITQLEVVGDSGGTEPGAKRILNGVFHETLLTLDDEERTFSYSTMVLKRFLKRMYRAILGKSASFR